MCKVPHTAAGGDGWVVHDERLALAGFAVARDGGARGESRTRYRFARAILQSKYRSSTVAQLELLTAATGAWIVAARLLTDTHGRHRRHHRVSLHNHGRRLLHNNLDRDHTALSAADNRCHGSDVEQRPIGLLGDPADRWIEGLQNFVSDLTDSRSIRRSNYTLPL